MQKGSHSFLSVVLTLTDLFIDSTLPCFAAFGVQTANQLRDRFQPALTHSLVGGYVDRLIDSSLGSHWTRLYDSVSYVHAIMAATLIVAPTVSVLLSINPVMLSYDKT